MMMITRANMVEEGKQEVAWGNSGRPSKFRVGDREENYDQISNLPDAILLYILSFLSVDDAIPTSMLCKRWRNLWRWIDNLDFSMHCGKLRRNSAQFIEKALRLHEGLKIKTFCLRFQYNSNYISYVDSWLNFAVSRAVEKLVLDLFCVEDGVQPYALPPSIYKCGSLRELEVNICHIRPPPSFCLASLNRLVISNTVFVGDTLRDLISGCPVLEELVLVNCNQSRDLDIVILNQNLKRMKIVEFPDEVEEGTEVKIYAPHLLHLELHSGEPRPYHIQDASSIVSAFLDMRRIATCLAFNPYNQNNYLQVLANIMIGLHDVKALRLSGCCVQAMLTHEDMRHCLPTPLHHRLKHLTLDVRLVKAELPGIACLLRNSPELESLTIQLCRNSHMDRDIEPVCSANACLSDWSEESFWDCHPAPFHSLKYNLKKVVVENFKGEDGEIRFLTFLLKNSLVLKEILILVSPKSFIGSVESYVEYCSKDRRASKKNLENIRKLLVPPRSPNAEILFAGEHKVECTAN